MRNNKRKKRKRRKIYLIKIFPVYAVLLRLLLEDCIKFCLCTCRCMKTFDRTEKKRFKTNQTGMRKKALRHEVYINIHRKKWYMRVRVRILNWGIRKSSYWMQKLSKILSSNKVLFLNGTWNCSRIWKKLIHLPWNQNP